MDNCLLFSSEVPASLQFNTQHSDVNSWKQFKRIVTVLFKLLYALIDLLTNTNIPQKLNFANFIYLLVKN